MDTDNQDEKNHEPSFAESMVKIASIIGNDPIPNKEPKRNSKGQRVFVDSDGQTVIETDQRITQDGKKVVAE